VVREFFFAAVFVLVLITNAQGADIRVVTEELPPYMYTQDGRVCGFTTEIIRATLDQSGLDYTIEAFPWARAYEMARTQEDVLIYSILKLPWREKQFKWIKLDGLSAARSLFKPKYRQDINITSLSEAKEYRIGVTRKSSTHHFLLSRGFRDGVNLFPVNCEELNLLKSQPGTMRIDLTTGDRISLVHWTNASGLPSDYWKEQMPLFEEDLYMAFGLKTSDDLVEKVRKAFGEIRDQGKLDVIREKYSAILE